MAAMMCMIIKFNKTLIIINMITAILWPPSLILFQNFLDPSFLKATHFYTAWLFFA